jgi:hypothetical protein
MLPRQPRTRKGRARSKPSVALEPNPPPDPGRSDNGRPVRVGSIVVADGPTIGRVAIVRGPDLIMEHLYDGSKHHEIDGTSSWRCDEVTVLREPTPAAADEAHPMLRLVAALCDCARLTNVLTDPALGIEEIWQQEADRGLADVYQVIFNRIQQAAWNDSDWLDALARLARPATERGAA